MFKNWLRGALSVAMIAGFAGTAGAVGLAGNYHETNGIIINIPQNQPLVACDAASENARCHFKQQAYFGQGAGNTTAPQAGVLGAASIVGDPRAVGDAFELPPGFMNQTKTQDAQVLGNVAIYLVTSFMASAPGTERVDYGGGANPDTRQFAQRAFSVGNVNAHGQNNGLATTDPNYEYRQAINTTVTDTFNGGLERVTVTYKGGSGFSGTASLLLDGGGDLYIGGPNIDALVTAPNAAPIIGLNPLGDGIAGNPVTRNGAGWNYVITGGQAPGTVKGFGIGLGITHDIMPGGPCTSTAAPALPEGCNIVDGFASNGFFLFNLPSATSAKHLYAWTTGTVSITRQGTRMAGAATIQDTNTMVGDGHDSTSAFATGLRRNVGLVAGSYSKRTDGTGSQQINAQLSGMNLVFTPEPASAAALLAGVGLLGTMAVRRGRR
ncbi:MAG: hypothetical protein CL931_02335 [Deltaproteobacteria bacterium]|nr:hypothetical protein [Deltaproteobacteria bacterium]